MDQAIPLSFTDHKNFGPTVINEFILVPAGGGVTIAPSDDKASRSVTGINTPLLYPEANTTNLIPSLNFGTVANCGPGKHLRFGPFVQNCDQ